MNLSLNTSAALAQTATGDIGVTVLKKSMDSETQGAIALINAIPQPAPALPPNLGRHINTTA